MVETFTHPTVFPQTHPETNSGFLQISETSQKALKIASGLALTGIGLALMLDGTINQSTPELILGVVAVYAGYRVLSS